MGVCGSWDGSEGEERCAERRVPAQVQFWQCGSLGERLVLVSSLQFRRPGLDSNETWIIDSTGYC